MHLQQASKVRPCTMSFTQATRHSRAEHWSYCGKAPSPTMRTASAAELPGNACTACGHDNYVCPGRPTCTHVSASGDSSSDMERSVGKGKPLPSGFVPVAPVGDSQGGPGETAHISLGLSSWLIWSCMLAKAIVGGPTMYGCCNTGTSAVMLCSARAWYQ